MERSIGERVANVIAFPASAVITRSDGPVIQNVRVTCVKRVLFVPSQAVLSNSGSLICCSGQIGTVSLQCSEPSVPRTGGVSVSAPNQNEILYWQITRLEMNNTRMYVRITIQPNICNVRGKESSEVIQIDMRVGGGRKGNRIHQFIVRAWCVSIVEKQHPPTPIGGHVAVHLEGIGGSHRLDGVHPTLTSRGIRTRR